MQIKIVNRFINDLHNYSPILFIKHFSARRQFSAPQKANTRRIRADPQKWVSAIILWVGLAKDMCKEELAMAFIYSCASQVLLCSGH